MHLLVEAYLEEVFHQTPYAINVYVKPTNLAMRLTRLSWPEIEEGRGPAMQLCFVS